MAMDGIQRFEVIGGVQSLGAVMGSTGPIGAMVSTVDPVKNAPEVNISRTPEMTPGGMS
ncbi:MAG: hypothetical protein KDJ26_01475 [Alphaproteobacteria bacterium]|nr:hypothetical protein [Alphaproteobacteria bacterium]MCB9985723.1 hypothetical protein [Micavibrio sp.]HPQ51059.1 hypothetical protein [Alphaproteobacteria bacterium]